MNQTQEMLMRQSLGENPAVTSAMGDPFLGGNAAITTTASQQQQAAVAAALAAEPHNRQESADSGVGGMGSNLHLVSIPEDLPVDMDSAMDVSGNDLDTTLTNDNANGPAAAAAAVGGKPSSSMDTSKGPGEELLPNLPAELGEALSDNIMQEVLSPAAAAGPQAQGQQGQPPLGATNQGLTWL